MTDCNSFRLGATTGYATGTVRFSHIRTGTRANFGTPLRPTDTTKPNETPGNTRLAVARFDGVTSTRRSTMLRKGQMVMVYDDPVTKTRPEGKARLLRKLGPETGDGLEYWTVQILDAGDGMDDVWDRWVG